MTELLKLERNYRSTPRICAVAQRLIERNDGRVPKLLVPIKADGGEVAVQQCSDFDAEVLFIVNTVRRLKVEVSSAVIVRTNAMVELFANALAGYGLPVSRKEASDTPKDWRVVSAFASCLIDVSNDLTCSNFIAELKGQDQADKSTREAGSKMVNLNDHCLNFKQVETAREAAAYIIATRPSQESIAKLHSILEPLPDDATVADLVIAMSQPSKQSEMSAGTSVVTGHSSKGREWGTVFVPCFEEGVWPTNRDQKTTESLQEARRLAFVAFTRAETNLFLTYCRVRQQMFGSRAEVEMQPSRFIAEAGLA